jgi:hypothetical protein
MSTLKKILFFLLLPVYALAILFLNLTLDWWQKLLD